MNDKIKQFESIPDSVLQKISTDNPVSDAGSNISVDTEFQSTNSHTKDNAFTSSGTPELPKEPATGNTTNTGESFKLSEFANGEMALSLIDMLIPSLISFGFRYAGYELDAKDIQLTVTEKNNLSPTVQKIMERIHVNLDNPVYALVMTLGIAYGSKVINKSDSIKKKKDLKPKTTKEIEQEIMSDTELNDIEKYEKAYDMLIEEIANKRRRGTGDAKEYAAKNYQARIKGLQERFNVQNLEHLNYVHESKRKKKQKDEFYLG